MSFVLEQRWWLCDGINPPGRVGALWYCVCVCTVETLSDSAASWENPVLHRQWGKRVMRVAFSFQPVYFWLEVFKNLNLLRVCSFKRGQKAVGEDDVQGSYRCWRWREQSFAASSRVEDSGRVFRWVWCPVKPVQRVWKLGEEKQW